jgi:hypothetical protein
VKRSLTLLVVLLVGLPTCKRGTISRVGAGQMDISWTGSERGRLSGRATAEWCAILRLLEIRGIGGDTGIALAIYPVDTVTPGQYRVMDPAKAESLHPAAGIALRWASPTAIKGFQGESGSVLVERSRSGELSGRVSAAARSATDTGRLDVIGTFRKLVPRTSTRGCAPHGADTLDTPDDTLVD